MLRRLAEICLSGIFIIAGFEAAKEPGGRVKKAEAFGMPDPEMAVRANGAAMVAGGAALALGIVPRLAALGLIACLVPTTLAGHRFWEEESAARSGQRLQFLKNLGLIGGLVLVIAPGKKK
jgi:uncharacterized membrane protein YphA (DoxX/SURF4 family)